MLNNFFQIKFIYELHFENLYTQSSFPVFYDLLLKEIFKIDVKAMILRVSVHSWVATTGTGKKTFRIRILVLIAEVQAQHTSN